MHPFAQEMMTPGLFGNPTAPARPSPLNFDMVQSMPMIGGFANFAMSQYMAGNGYIPAGFFPTGQNPYEAYRDMQFHRNHMAVMEEMSTVDAARGSDILGGMYKLFGGDLTPKMQAGFDAASDRIRKLGPMAAMMAPDLVDQLMGSRGSAMVMAQNMLPAMRYQVDPVTGRQGVSAESSSRFILGMHQQLYGPDADISDMRGLRAGQVGDLYNSLYGQGYGPGSIGALSTENQISRLAEHYGATPETMQRIKDTRPDDFGDYLRTFDQDQAASRIKDVAGSVEAVSEIMGGMGYPNAPMPVLIKALNSLTQGGLHHMRPEQLEQTVREMQAIAKQTGMGMDAVIGISTGMAAYADKIGVDRSFATQAAMSAAAFGGALKDTGAGGITSFGSMSPEELVLADAQMFMRGAAGDAANQMGAAVRMFERGGIDASSEFGQYVEEIKAGRGRDMSYAELQAMAERSGINVAELDATIGQRAANQEYVHNAGIAEQIAGDARRNEMMQVMAQSMPAGMASVLGGETAAAVAPEFTRRLFEEFERDPTALDDSNKMQTYARVMREAMEAQGIDSSGYTDAQLAASGDLGMGQAWERNARDPNLKGLGSALDMIKLATGGEARQREQQAAKTRADMNKAASSLGHGGPIGRMIDALSEDPESLGGIAAKFFGGVSADDFKAKLAQGIVDTSATDQVRGAAMMEETAKLLGDLAGQSPEGKAELQKTIDAIASGGDAAEARIREMLKQVGMTESADQDRVLSGEMAAPEEIRSQIQTLRTAAQKDESGRARGGLRELTEAQLAADRIVDAKARVDELTEAHTEENKLREKHGLLPKKMSAEQIQLQAEMDVARGWRRKSDDETTEETKSPEELSEESRRPIDQPAPAPGPNETAQGPVSISGTLRITGDLAELAGDMTHGPDSIPGTV